MNANLIPGIRMIIISQRQGKSEAAALVQSFTGCDDRAVVGFDQGFGYGEANSAAAPIHP